MKKTPRFLIVDGPNSIGKDTFLDALMKRFSEIRPHYASSGIITNPEIRVTEEDLTLICYTTFFTNYKSMIRDREGTYHVQYRSPLSNIIYNNLKRPNALWLSYDHGTMMNFMAKHYDERFIFLMYSFTEEDLLDLKFSGSEADQRRMERKGFKDTFEANNLYREAWKEIRADKRLRFATVTQEGKGLMTVLYDFDKMCSTVGVRNDNITIFYEWLYSRRDDD